MKKLFLFVLALLGLGGLLFASLPINYSPPIVNSVVPLQSGSVLYGIRACVQGLPGTSIMSNGQYLVFVWTYPNQSAAAFFAVDSSGNAINFLEQIWKGGNYANVKTVSELISTMKANGWSLVTPEVISGTLLNMIGTRVASAPAMLFTVGVFGTDGDFSGWFDSTFGQEMVDG